VTETSLTYSKAGERFGLSADAMRMRAHRLNWRTMPGNVGRTLILVPDDVGMMPPAHSPARAGEPDAAMVVLRDAFGLLTSW
jgi:hypothetical protein